MKKAAEKIEIGVIGGSGLYSMEAMKEVREVKVGTPFGAPSDLIITGRIGGVTVAFLPRHARGHKLLPAELPQLANIYALKKLGVRTVLAVSAVGSLREDFKPRHFVFPDQLVDKTWGRPSTFFGKGIVAHATFAHPFCGGLSGFMHRKALELGITAHKGGTLVCMEGPAFSTKAESEFHRKMGWDLIGMTAAPEAKLAREAAMCYCPIALVTDYDAWREGEEVTAALVVETLTHNTVKVKELLAAAIPQLAGKAFSCQCRSGMRGAVLTAEKSVSKAALKKLSVILQ